MFSRHKAGIPTIRQLKIIEVKKLADETKNLYKCNFKRTNSSKANKAIENFKGKSLSLYCPLFRDGCGGSSSRLSHHTSRILSFCLGEIPNNSTQDPQFNIDSSTVVFGRSTVFFSHLLWQVNSFGKFFLINSASMAKPSKLRSFNLKK